MLKKETCTSIDSSNERQSTHMRDSIEPKSASAYIGDGERNVTARGWVMGETTPSAVNDYSKGSIKHVDQAATN